MLARDKNMPTYLHGLTVGETAVTVHEIETDVLIIGGGIAGPALACGLKDRGYRVILVERSNEPLDTARGDHLQPFSCEILDRWNVLDRFLEAGAEKRLGTRWYSHRGEELLNVKLDDLPIPHPYGIYLNHERINELFLKSAQDNPQFSLMKPAKYVDIIDSNGFPVFVLEHDGEVYHIDAKLVVGADGQTSTMRYLFSIESQLHRYDALFMILWAERHTVDSRNELLAYITHKGVVSFVPRTGGKWKIGLPIRKSEVSAWRESTISDRAMWIEERIPKIVGLKTHFVGFYQPVMLSTKRWVWGNMVLIGDSCHAMHPGQSQGMNVALRCIDRLIEHLPAPGNMGLDEVTAALQAYEANTRLAVDSILEANHQRGLAMDRLEPEECLAQESVYRSVQSDPDALIGYRMRAAGYPIR